VKRLIVQFDFTAHEAVNCSLEALMPIKFHTPGSPPPKSAEKAFSSDYDEPDPLFQVTDGPYDTETASAPSRKGRKLVDVAKLEEAFGPPEVPQGGGGGTGGTPVGEMPFIAEDYGLAGNPDSSVPSLVTEPLAEPVGEAPPAMVAVEFDTLVDEEPVPADEPVADTAPAPIEDPSKSDDVSDPLESLIYFYLQVNKSPSDEQMHMLAAALGIGKERLEECVYRILRALMDESDYRPPTENASVLVDSEFDDEVVEVHEAADASDDDGAIDADDDSDILMDDTGGEESLEESGFGDPGGQADGEVTDGEPIHDPLVDPETDDEMIQNDGQPVDDELEDTVPVGFNDGAPV
jgi:hypothetical protein